MRLDWRIATASDASNEIYLNLGGLNQPPNWDGTQEPWRIWEDVSSFFVKWANEPAYDANPSVKRKRCLLFGWRTFQQTIGIWSRNGGATSIHRQGVRLDVLPVIASPPWPPIASAACRLALRRSGAQHA